LRASLEELGYVYRDETHNPAYRLFVGGSENPTHKTGG
jgi:hypothetical protein